MHNDDRRVIIEDVWNVENMYSVNDSEQGSVYYRMS